MALLTRQLFSLVFSAILLLSLSFAKLSNEEKDDLEGGINKLIEDVKGNDNNAKALKNNLTELKTKVKMGVIEIKKMDLSKVISALDASIKKLQSPNSVDIATGCLDLLAGLASSIGPLSALSPIFSIISMVVGLFSGGKVQESVGDVVKKALKEQYDEELEAEAYGTQRLFTVSKAFLDGVRKEPKKLTEKELVSLSANVPIYKGVKFIAVMVQRIKKAAPQKKEEAKKIINFMELLVDLCSIRDVILLDLYQQVSRAGHSPNIAAGILEVKNVGKVQFKEALKDLFKGDDPKRWILLSFLYPRNRSPQTIKIFKFLDFIGVSGLPGVEDNLSGIRIISALAYPKYCIASPNNNNMQGDYPVARYRRRQCTIKLKREPDLSYSMEVYKARTGYASEKYLYSAKKHSKDATARFNFIPVRKDSNKFYIISSMQWPDRFIYEMANLKGWIALHLGNPNDSGYQEKAFWTVSGYQDRAFWNTSSA